MIFLTGVYLAPPDDSYVRIKHTPGVVPDEQGNGVGDAQATGMRNGITFNVSYEAILSNPGGGSLGKSGFIKLPATCDVTYGALLFRATGSTFPASVQVLVSMTAKMKAKATASFAGHSGNHGEAKGYAWKGVYVSRAVTPGTSSKQISATKFTRGRGLRTVSFKRSYITTYRGWTGTIGIYEATSTYGYSDVAAEASAELWPTGGAQSASGRADSELTIRAQTEI